MPAPEDKIRKLKNAFAADGFSVNDQTGIVEHNGKLGLLATHRTAFNHDTQQPKKAYYIEGSPYELGYLMGRLAEPETARMATEFVDHIVIDMVDPGLPEILKDILGRIIADLAYGLSQKMKPDIPDQYRAEMAGLLDGCRAANPRTTATEKGVWLLNAGVDCLLSIIYRLDLFLDPFREKLAAALAEKAAHPAMQGIDAHVKRVRKLEPGLFHIPFMCNAFSACRNVVKDGGHFLGRDFMFATGGVFQDTAAMTIYNPDPLPGETAYPFLSLSAPGMIGSVAALNRPAPARGGTAGGVDMAASGNCDPDRPGLNSLLLVRHAVQHAATTEEALALINAAQRGVSWLYVLADGDTDQACIVEAGRTEETVDCLSFPPAELKPLLPDAAYLKAHPSAPLGRGLAARFSDYRYDDTYIEDFNPSLFREFGRTIMPGAFDRTGFIDPAWTDKNCPESFYFAPQRETNPDIVLASNHFIDPQMRLCAMHPWTNLVFSGHCDDIQWRYDALNSLLCRATDNGGKIGYKQARDLIDFLRPYDTDHRPGPYSAYYANAPRSRDGQEIMISGSVSLLDLKNNTMESHYGYYGDEWVKISLNAYV